MFFLLQGPMQNYSLMSATHSVGTGNSTTLAAFKLVTGVARRRGWKWGEDVQSGAGLGACCNNSNANVALDPRAERSHKHMQTSSPRLCGARRRDNLGILLLVINMSPIKTIEMETTSSFRMHCLWTYLSRHN